MFLTNLSNKQKSLFLDISIALSKVDNDFAEDEKKLIDTLCDEMNITPKYKTSKKALDCVNAINKISNAKEKRSIAIELLGIVMADKKIAKEEKAFMEKVFKIFNIKQSELKTAIDLVNNLYDIYAKFDKFLNR